MANKNTLKVALIQAAPVMFNLQATITKIISLVEKAASQNVDIVVFSETFIPCYPHGLSFGNTIGKISKDGLADWLLYQNNSIYDDGEASSLLAKCAADNKVFLSIGVSEREDNSATLYSSNFIYSPKGELVSKHRKIKSLTNERVLWNEGDLYAPSILEVNKARVATLIGSEAYLPLLRASYYQEGASMYFMPASDDSKAWQNCIRHIAKESRSYVFSCNQYITKEMYPKDLNHSFSLDNYPNTITRGGSAIIDPNGNYLVGPIYDKEAILLAEIDMGSVVESRYDLDPTGHFSRNDIFELTIKYKQK